MDRETDLTAKRFARALRKKMKIRKLILFGSRARGDNFISSDYDFIVVSDEFSGTRFPVRAARLLEIWKEKRDLEALCYTGDEWERLKEKRGILLNAQKDGVDY